MKSTSSLNLSLLSAPMGAVMTAQFLSAMGDNALIIAAIALLKAGGHGEASTGLQACFVIPFIVLAPFAGPIADSFPKGHVMLASNVLKTLGAAAMFTGLSPFVGYAVAGIGATLYSPAKYGILAQMFAPEKLVRANGMFEGSTIAAILIGTVLGGKLADSSIHIALGAVLAMYIVATLANLMIPRLAPEHPAELSRPSVFVRDFGHALATLTANRDARFSALGSSMFWGAGISLRLALFVWVPAALGLKDNAAVTNLMGVLSVGIVLGAALAGACITLKTVNRALIGGLLLGPVIIALAFTTHLYVAAALIALIGLCGGGFAIPLNALLQERGHETVGAGRALAVQNLVENLTMLLFVGFYAGLQAADVPVVASVAILGAALLAGLGTLTVWRLRARSAA